MIILIIVVFHGGFIGMNGIFDDDSEENSPRNIQKFPSLNVDQLRWKMPIANQRNHGILQQKLVKLRERSMVVSINGLPNSWMVSGKIHGKSYSNGWFGWGYTPILGKKTNGETRENWWKFWFHLGWNFWIHRFATHQRSESAVRIVGSHGQCFLVFQGTSTLW